MWIRLSLLLAVAVLCGCTMPIKQSSTVLVPAEVNLSAPPTMFFVESSWEHANDIPSGSTLVKIGDTTVTDYSELLSIVSNSSIFSQNVLIRSPDGLEHSIPMEDIFPGADLSSAVTWSEPGSTAIKNSILDPDGESLYAGGIYAGKLYGQLALKVWDSSPQLLEMQVVVQAGQGCEICGIKSLSVIDLERNSWVSMASLETAAFAIYPDLGAPGQATNVPAPTLAGGTAFSNTTGSINAYNYGNNLSGTYTANTTTNFVPRYDYTATNAAQMHNLGVSIRNERLSNQNTARLDFASSRIGNLRTGELFAGESVVGHLFFMLPAGFDGPYGVLLENMTGESAWLKFSIPIEEP